MVVEARQRRVHTSVTPCRLRVVDLDARPAAVIRCASPHAGLAAWLPGVVRRLDRELRRQRVSAIGPLFVRRRTTAAGVQVEAGYLVSEPIEDGAEVVASGLPGGPAIMAVGVRPDEVDDVDGVLREWLSTRGFRPSGAGWRCLREGPEHPAVDIVMPYRWR